MTKGFWEGDAIETKPDLASLASNGYPTNGDPARGIPATLPGAAWFYLMDSLRSSVIEASGLTQANPPTEEQFLTALRSWAWAEAGTLPLAKLAVGVIAVTAQSFSASEKKQARANIGMSDFYKEVIQTNGGTVSE